jgi:hypothetical protein
MNRIDEFSSHFIRWMDEWRQKTIPPTRNEPTVAATGKITNNIIPIQSAPTFCRQGSGPFKLSELKGPGPDDAA